MKNLMIRIKYECDYCGGKGKDGYDLCMMCKGKGTIKDWISIEELKKLLK